MIQPPEDLNVIVKPPRVFCEVKSQIYEMKAKIKAKTEEGRTKLREILGTIAAIKWGLKDFLKSTLQTAITSTATNIAKSITEDLTQLITNQINSILGSILGALIGGADSVSQAMLGMVDIVREDALKTASEERVNIAEIESAIASLSAIVVKWRKKLAPPEYLSAINDTIVNVDKVITGLNRVLDGLLTYGNAYFDKDEYKTALQNLSLAIENSDVETSLDRIFKPDEYINNKTAELIESDVVEIGRKSKADKKTAALNFQITANADTYRKDLSSIDVISKESIAIAGVNAKESAISTYLKDGATDSTSTLKGIKARGLAVADFAQNGVGDAAKRLKKEFSDDIAMSLMLIGELGESIGKAKLNSTMLQMKCNTITHFESKFSKILEFIAGLLMNMGNAFSIPVIEVIESSIDMTEVARDLLEEGKEPVVNSSKTARANSASNLTSARSLLVATDMLLSSTILDSIIDAINADEDFDTNLESFRNFKSNLSKIPDANGELGLWAAKPLQAAASPYLQMAKEAINFSTTVMVDRSNEVAIQDSVSFLRDSMNVCKTINSQAVSVLSSWSSERSPEMDKFKKALQAINLLGVFSMLGALDDLFGFIGIPEFGVETCEVAYPELFESPDIVKAADDEAVNTPDITHNGSAKVSDAIEGVSGNIARVRSMADGIFLLDESDSQGE